MSALDVFYWITGTIVTIATLYFSKKMIQSRNPYANFVGLMILGVTFSSMVLGPVGMIFGFIPVLSNSIVVTFILRKRV